MADPKDGGRRAMATVRLSRIELDHVLTILRDASRHGDYYGDRRQYWNRHERVWKRLEMAYSDITNGGPYPLKPSVVGGR